MKRLFALLLILNLLVLGLSAANGASSYSLEGGTRNREVVFRADAFVRLGFASIPVMTTVSPSSEVLNSNWTIEDINNELKTDYIYLYCQVFTPERVKISITSSGPLKGKSNGTDHNWNWHTVFSGQKGTMAEGTNHDFSSSTATYPFPIYEENAVNAGETNYLLSARNYCWEFSVIIDDENGAKAPSPDKGSIASTSIVFTVESVE